MAAAVLERSVSCAFLVGRVAVYLSKRDYLVESAADLREDRRAHIWHELADHVNQAGQVGHVNAVDVVPVEAAGKYPALGLVALVDLVDRQQLRAEVGRPAVARSGESTLYIAFVVEIPVVRLHRTTACPPSYCQISIVSLPDRTGSGVHVSSCLGCALTASGSPSGSGCNDGQ